MIHKYDIILFRPFSLELSERRAIIFEKFIYFRPQKLTFPVELLVIGEYRSINSVFEIDNHDCFNSDVLLLFLDVL